MGQNQILPLKFGPCVLVNGHLKIHRNRMEAVQISLKTVPFSPYTFLKTLQMFLATISPKVVMISI